MGSCAAGQDLGSGSGSPVFWTGLDMQSSSLPLWPSYYWPISFQMKTFFFFCHKNNFSLTLAEEAFCLIKVIIHFCSDILNVFFIETLGEWSFQVLGLFLTVAPDSISPTILSHIFLSLFYIQTPGSLSMIGSGMFTTPSELLWNFQYHFTSLFSGAHGVGTD